MFHENIEALYRYLKEKYDMDKPVFISLNQAAKYCGKDPRTLKADDTFPKKIIGKKEDKVKQFNVSVIGLARWLS